MCHLFNRYVFSLLTKMRTETETVPFTRCVFNVQGCTHWFSQMCPILLLVYMKKWWIFIGKSETLLPWLAICLLFYGFISHLFGDHANINMWKSDFMKAWNSIKNVCVRYVKNRYPMGTSVCCIGKGIYLVRTVAYYRCIGDSAWNCLFTSPKC